MHLNIDDRINLLIKLPILPKINPYYNKVKDISNKWIIENNLVNGFEEKFVEWDIPLYTSLAYVDCTIEKLRPLCDYFSWLFLIDDKAEKLNEKEVWKLFKGTLEIIEFDKTYENDIWSITFLDLWKRMNMNNKYRKELLESKKEYIRGVINQKSINFDITSYIENRSMDVGAKILSTLIKYAYEIEIDEEITDNIYKIMGYCFGLANDIFSFKNEQSYNIINVLMKEKKCTLEKAIIQSNKLLQLNIEKLNEVCNISNINNIYLNGLKYIITGTICWTNNNPRYNYRGNRKNLIKSNYNYEKNKKNMIKIYL